MERTIVYLGKDRIRIFRAVRIGTPVTRTRTLFIVLEGFVGMRLANPAVIAETGVAWRGAVNI
jgi:hypothetical protein